VTSPPGECVLRIGMYNWADGVRLAISEAGSMDTTDSVLTLGVVVVGG
jgi:hypothetical protein